MSRWGTCYVLIAIGTLDERCEPADLEAVRSLVAERVPFQVAALDGDQADAVTVALMRQAGAL